MIQKTASASIDLINVGEERSLISNACQYKQKALTAVDTIGFLFCRVVFLNRRRSYTRMGRLRKRTIQRLKPTKD